MVWFGVGALIIGLVVFVVACFRAIDDGQY